MEVGIEAARWVVGKALGPAAGGVLEAWAASSELGTNIRALRMELLYAQGMLNNAPRRGLGWEDIHNPALEELLHELRDLAYNADDALDEVDYFRIQDELDGTYHAADEHAGGCLHNHTLNARHTIRGIGKMLGLSSSSRSASHGHRDEPSESTRGVSCGAWPCRGHGSTDDDEQEYGASRGVSCGAWPCGRASRPQPTRRRLQSTNQADQVEEEVQKGCLQKLASGACNTINIFGKHLPCNSVSSPVQNDANSDMASNGRRFLCCGRPNNSAPQRELTVPTPKLKFDRVEMSKKIKEITEQLKPVCAKVSTILNLELLDSNRSIAQCIATSLDTMLSKKQGRIPVPTHSAAKSRPKTTAELMEPKIYGRENEINKIIYDITKGDYCDKDLTVLPIVGLGGIGKTTLTQVIYKQLQHHFEEKIWVCVSTTFSVYKLTQEIMDNMKLSKTDSPEKLIEEKLKSKKFLLVLDDMWSCSDNDWGRFLVPFTKGQTKGSIVLVTTRFPVVAQMVKTTNSWIDLKSIDSEAFKDLFLAYVFGDKNSSNDHKGLLDIGFKIVEKLKGSPLAAKTVGRLLKKNLDLDHWNRVLESKEWESANGENDIMPALKLSYDYLPFHLQHCFSYCALFPEDYKFEAEELIHLWIGLDVLHSHGDNKRIEDIGRNHLIELVNSGFFKKEGEDGKLNRYVIHDLLHDLALKISSHECLSINSANVGSTQIPPSIRYLSINIDDTSVKDKITFDTCQKDLSTLVKRLQVGSLRSFMLFGQYQGSFVKTVVGFLKGAKALRVIFLSNARYNSEVLLHNLPYFVHLRYLRIKSNYWTIKLPNIISRFYHLRVLDLRECDYQVYSIKDMVNLVKLRHFLVQDSEMHSSICEVGKLTSLQELTRFVAKRKSQDFELNQIGHLTELCGSLEIKGLEKIELMEEVDGAKLIKKTHLRKLLLHWDSGRSNKNPTQEEHVLESLKPSSNLLELYIRGHGGFACPSWLSMNLSLPNLESVQFDDVSWKSLPPLGELWLVDEQGKEYMNCIPSQSFNNLKRLELVKIPKFKKWIGNGPCELFSHLKVLIFRDCPELMELPFTHHTGCEPEHEDHMTWFHKLELIEIVSCPNLSSLPCIPWSSAICSVKIEQIGSTLKNLNLRQYYGKYHLEIEGKDALDSSFWKVLSFHNLSELEVLEVTRCPPLSLDNLQMLSSLKTLKISDMSNAFLVPERDSQIRYQFPVERVIIEGSDASGEALTRLLSYFTELRDVEIRKCEMLTGLSVVNQQKNTGALERLVTSSAIESEKEAQIVPQEQQQYDTSGEEEIAAATTISEGLLLLPPQLQELEIWQCPNLVLCTDSLDCDKEDAGQTGSQGWGLQGLCSLRLLRIIDCPRFLSSYSSSFSSSCFPFPTSLEELFLLDAVGTATSLPLSNLTSLTYLYIRSCGDLRAEGLRHLLAQGRLTKLCVFETPNFFAGPEPPLPHEQEFPSSSSKLQELETDHVAGVLAASVWTFLSPSLTDLRFCGNKEVERFTKEQEDALQLLTSLEEIRFWFCDKLQCLPAGLHRLSNLKRLHIWGCTAIRSLPKDGLPSSLQELVIDNCPAIQSLPKDCLPCSLQKLRIERCPSIRSLPKVNDLPSSLRELDVRDSENEELRRQCRKLIGIIPVVYA